MDLSVIAAVGSFVVSERVLKPKATVLVILGLVLIYDLKTKTHDVSSLRVYRGTIRFDSFVSMQIGGINLRKKWVIFQKKLTSFLFLSSSFSLYFSNRSCFSSVYIDDGCFFTSDMATEWCCM